MLHKGEMCKFSKCWLQMKLLSFTVSYLPPANEVWGKAIFSEACVKNSNHGGCMLPGGVPGLRGVCFRGGCLLWGVPGPGGAWWRHPRRLLLRAVRILLEFILVLKKFYDYVTKYICANLINMDTRSSVTLCLLLLLVLAI